MVVIRKEVALGATAHLDTVERNAPVSLEVHTVWCCQASATYMHVGRDNMKVGPSCASKCNVLCTWFFEIMKIIKII